ncbi:hypothetical protein BU23DRAFT_584167 [Bimuria novae-zelandiae CBS 107.79]|uniref:C2H2-type domain-containing protein n=1 Tax=Bimuria novae-zelandiae CBS 107.79 TaxID=1447943 RepID=A0A6A5UQY9_9PLEO|nr:hypothetical protein BU23DRAFT_584167 [Bimuria novae-zelandiae CBS 107.79]
MRRRLPIHDSSDESEYTESNADGSVTSDTDLTDDETCSNVNGKQGEENYPPQHYTSMLETFDEREYTKEDYKESSTRLLDPVSQVLRKLAKKHGLKKIGRDKACMYVEDLAQVLETNLVTTKKQYSHGRYWIQTQVYLQLGSFTANQPKALLSLCYRHVQVTLLRDLEGGPHRVLLKLTFEFTKEFLRIKDMNTFPIPEIIYNETLTFSPHVFLLGMLFHDRAFAAYNLTSPEELSRLSILLERNKLLLRFAQVTRPYSLRYAGGKAFNKNSNVSEAMQNLMMGHANIRTFLKHYLSRRVTVDTQAVVRGIQPQDALMRAACTMSRSIDARRPRSLTPEQSALVNNYLIVRSLLAERERLKRSEYEQPVRDVEQQLAGIKAKDVAAAAMSCDAMLPAQKALEVSRRNRAIRAVIDYCGIKEGGIHLSQLKQLKGHVVPLVTREEELQRKVNKELEAAKVSVYKEKRPRICFVCLGNKKLPTAKRTHSFHTPGDLSKHFMRRHLANVRDGDLLRCGLCQIDIEHKMHWQQHAHEVHGTVSLRAA